jgi:hypothetical protein
METLDALEKEFEEAENSYSLDGRVQQKLDDKEWSAQNLQVIAESPAVGESVFPPEIYQTVRMKTPCSMTILLYPRCQQWLQVLLTRRVPLSTQHSHWNHRC